MHVPGATSFEFLRTFEGEVYPTFQAAARARGLLQNDTEWSAAMTEAALFQTASSLRKLFCVLIAFSGAYNPCQIWLDHRESMTEDYRYRYQQDSRNASSPLFEISQEMYNHCFLDLNDILANHQYDPQSMEECMLLLYAEALDAEDPDFLPFNENQALVYHTIRDVALEESPDLGPRIFFVDGPGGTGKTFVFNALLNRFRMDGENAIAAASSGTAALLLKGGRTAHHTVAALNKANFLARFF